MAHLIETVRELDERGIGFRSLTEGVDTTTPSGTLVFHIFGALAQFDATSSGKGPPPALKWPKPEGGRVGGNPWSRPTSSHGRAHIVARLTVREAAARVKVGNTALYHALSGSTESPKA